MWLRFILVLFIYYFFESRVLGCPVYPHTLCYGGWLWASDSHPQVWGSQAHATMSSLFCLWSGAEDKTQGLVSRNHETYHWATPQNWKLLIRKQDESILWLATVPHTSGNFKLSWECVLAGSGAGNQHTTHLCVSEPVFIIQSVLLHSCQL